MTAHEIAAVLHCSPDQVRDRLRKQGVEVHRTGPRELPVSTDDIIELRDNGLSWSQVAHAVGMSKSGSARRYHAAMGCTCNQGKHHAPRCDYCRDAFGA
ncbi:hypothetical protein [Stackebrandtia soli]|uniref:hypothetical protein n=1 Tax=Stackebrandtia soli TaxID=1892856 RepID=UPI0039ED89AD